MKTPTPRLSRALRAMCSPTVLTVCALLTGWPAQAATYYFSTTGNDNTGDGSQNLPWQSLAKAAQYMVTNGAGNTIRLKRGNVWYEKDVTWSVTQKYGTVSNPVIVEDWGDTGLQLPVIAHMENLNSGWTSIGSNRWRHALPSFTVMDCFMDGNRLQGVTGSSNVTDATKWAQDASYLYVYASTDPGSTHLVEANANGYTLSADDITNVTFRNLEFIGGRWTSVGVSVPTTNVTFDSCRIIRPGHWGIVFIDVDPTPLRHTNPKVINCYLNLSWATYLNSLTTSNNKNGITLESADYGLVQGNIVADFGHTAIALEGSTNCIVEDNTTYPVYTNYYRALEVFAGPALPASDTEASTDNIIRRNLFLNQAQVSSKLWGQRNKYYSNVWTGARLTDGFNHNPEGNEADFLTTGETVRDNLIVNNTFVDTGDTSLLVNLYVGPNFTSGSVRQNTIANNLFLDWGQQSATAYGLYVSAANTANGSDQLVYNNNFWKTSNSEFVIKDLMAAQGANNYQYTAAQANASISGYSANTQANPLLVDKSSLLFDLQNGSPVALTGKDMQTLMGSGFVDFDGQPWASTPSAGAFQYAPNFVTAVTPSAGTYNNLTQWVGLKFTVGTKNIRVSKLGRYTVSGNTQKHTVKLVAVATGTDVSGGATTVDTAGLPAGIFAFAPLAAPVTLTAGASYYLISSETAGGDLWHGYSSALTTSGEATVNSAVSYNGSFTTIGVAGNSYGPVAFKIFDAYTTEFDEVQTLSTGLYNNSTGWRGLKFTTGGSPVTVGYLGRWVRSGNSQTHTVKLVNASTGLDVTNGTVSVATSGMPAGDYTYAKLAVPVTLAANTAYYLVSSETNGQDFWYGSGTALTSTGVATINSAVYNDTGTWVTTGTGGNSFGPVNFKY